MKKRILIIDDDIMLNKINEKVLVAAGIVSELHVTNNGVEGMNYLQHRIDKSYSLPEIIILDLDMPLMNGFEFIEGFQKLQFPGKSAIEIVVFTGSSNPKDKQKATALGIRHYINKPYLVRGLIDVITRMETEEVNIYSNKKSLGKFQGTL